MVALHVVMPECQLDPNTSSVDKCKMLISYLNNHVEKLKEKYEKDRADGRDKLLHELKGKCETTHHQFTHLISQGQSYLPNGDIIFLYNIQWPNATKTMNDETNIIEENIWQAYANYRLSKDLSSFERSTIQELHEKYYELQQKRGDIILPLGKL